MAWPSLEQANDQTIRQYAIDHDFVIVTKDADFYEMNTLYGPPPQIVWLKLGNQSKAATIKALIEQALLEDQRAYIEIL